MSKLALAIMLILIVQNGLNFVLSEDHERTKIILEFHIYAFGIDSQNRLSKTSVSNAGIYLDASLYHDGDIISYPFGSHNIKAKVPANYTFLIWYSSPDIKIDNITSQETNAYFSGILPIITIIGAKGIATLNLYLIKNISNMTYNSIIEIINSINKEANDKFLPYEKINIKLNMTINLPPLPYQIFNVNLTYQGIIFSNNTFLKREDLKLTSIDEIKWSYSINAKNLKSSYSFSFVFPDGNYELGISNVTGKRLIIIKHSLYVSFYLNSQKITFYYEGYSAVIIVVSGITPLIKEIYDFDKYYNFTFSLHWLYDFSEVKRKQGIISINLEELRYSSGACDREGRINLTLEKSSLNDLLKGYMGSLTVIPQFLGNGIIPFSMNAKIEWSKIATVVVGVNKSSIILKIIKLSDFSPVINATVKLYIEDNLYEQTNTDERGYAIFPINEDIRNKTIKVNVEIYSAKEILIPCKYSDIVIYDNWT